MQINVKLNEVNQNHLYLTQHLGSGSLGDLKFSASFTLPNYNLLVEVNDKKYMVSSQDIIEAVMNKHDKLFSKE